MLNTGDGKCYKVINVECYDNSTKTSFCYDILGITVNNKMHHLIRLSTEILILSFYLFSWDRYPKIIVFLLEKLLLFYMFLFSCKQFGYFHLGKPG